VTMATVVVTVLLLCSGGAFGASDDVAASSKESTLRAGRHGPVVRAGLPEDVPRARRRR